MPTDASHDSYLQKARKRQRSNKPHVFMWFTSAPKLIANIASCEKNTDYACI